MAMQTVTIEVGEIDASFFRALVTMAEKAGKSLTELFDDLKVTGQPMKLPLDGGEVILQDVESYQRLLAELEHAETVAGIQRGVAAMKAGQTRPVKEFLADLRKEYQFPESRPVE